MIMDKYGNVEFDIHCRMKARWVPYFLAMLTPTQAMTVAGIDEDALTEAVGKNFVKTPKERTLVIK